MAEYLARFTVPGWDPNNPVVDRGRYPVYDPRNDIFAGEVRVAISNGGLTNINSTLPGQVFHDGQVVRSLVRNAAGDWFVITEGFGNNPNGFYNGLNKEAGPVLFNYIDRQMYKYIMEDRMPKIEP